MAQHQGAAFANETVVLDGNEYLNCTFTNCEIVFNATGTVSMNGVTANNCRWTFDGAAGLTVKFLTALYQGGFSEMVEMTFDSIRRGSHEQSGAAPGGQPRCPCSGRGMPARASPVRICGSL